MNSYLIKTGYASIVLGSNHYMGFINPRTNMLLKITKRTTRHNEFKFLNIVRTIKNYQDYYSIPEETIYILTQNEDFYDKVKDLVKQERMNIFHGDLECYFINYAGDMDIQESMEELQEHKYSLVWQNHDDILHFAFKIMTAINFLHEKKLCHLDIKPENIVVNSITKEFRIIDFGFCAMEPFAEYVVNPAGTPGYFPKKIKSERGMEWWGKIKANDLVEVNNETPMMRNPELVYKIDSFCLGRTLYYITYLFDKQNKPLWYHCWGIFNFKREKITRIMNDLLCRNVYSRVTIKECLNTYF